MTESGNESPRPLGLGAKLILLLVGGATLELIIPWCVQPPNARHEIPWRQGSATLLVALPLFAVLYAWLVKARAAVLARSLVSGLLVGASVIIQAGAALAAFDYAVTRDLGVALRILPVVVFLAPMVGAVGCVIGCFVGMLASVFEQRAAKAAAIAPDAPAGQSRPWRQSLLAKLAVCLLVAAVVAALYSPVAYELTRRRAVLTIRAAGGHVSFDASRRVRIAEHAGPLGDLFSWIDARDHNTEREGWFYSLECAFSVVLPPGATDEQLAEVFDLPEVAHLTLRETNVTTAGLERVGAELTLSALDFSHTSVSPEALGCLANAASLYRLNLSHSRITDEGFAIWQALNRCAI